MRFAGQRVYGFAGIVIVLTLQLYPLIFLYVTGALKNVDNSLLEASDNTRAGSGSIRGGDLPYRPAPQKRFTDSFERDEARGLWVPNPGMKRLLSRSDLYASVNFRFMTRSVAMFVGVW